MDDSEIIELYLARNEDAIRHTQFKYGALCQTIAFNVLGNTEDSEECVNDTYLSLWNNIPPEIPGNLKAYVCRIARNISISRVRKNTAKKRGRDMLISLSDVTEADEFAYRRENSECLDNTDSDKEIGALIDEFLRTQPTDIRNVFLRKYFFGDSVADISKRFQFSQSKVKSMLFHTRKKLEKFLAKEGIFL